MRRPDAMNNLEQIVLAVSMTVGGSAGGMLLGRLYIGHGADVVLGLVAGALAAVASLALIRRLNEVGR